MKKLLFILLPLSMFSQNFISLQSNALKINDIKLQYGWMSNQNEWIGIDGNTEIGGELEKYNTYIHTSLFIGYYQHLGNFHLGVSLDWGLYYAHGANPTFSVSTPARYWFNHVGVMVRPEYRYYWLEDRFRSKVFLGILYKL